MQCQECNSEVSAVKDADFEASGIVNYFPVNTALQANIRKFSVPFICKTCGALKFPYQALHGIVMVWPEPIPESRGSIYIPERIREEFKNSNGFVLSSGKGCKERKTGKFVKSELRPGDLILYDRTIPWHLDVLDSDKKTQTIDIMNILDVHAVITEE